MSIQQYIRRCNLYVAGGDGEGMDLSNLRIKFVVKKSDAQSPNTAEITVYNLADSTTKQIKDEYKTCTLQAGYEGNFGVIFDGNIKQVIAGREDLVTKYLYLSVADGDAAYNYAVVNATLAAGATQEEQITAASAPMTKLGISQGYVDPLSKNQSKLPRGKTMFGASRDYLRTSAQSTNTVWSIQDGRLQVVKRSAVLPGQAVVLTSKTGLVGAPEQTDKGIKIRCLINPTIRVGGTVKVNESDVVEMKISSAPKGSEANTPSSLSADGVYKVMVVEYTGDTFGTDWFCDLTCVGVDVTAPEGEQVEEEL